MRTTIANVDSVGLSEFCSGHAPRGCGMALAFVVALSCACGTTAAVVPPNAVEEFKALLSAPPIIEQLIYREKLPPRPSAPVPADTGVASSTNYAIYELRWQTNGMCVRTLESNLAQGRIDAYRATFSLWNDNIWFLDHPTNVFVYHLEHERVRLGHVPPSYDAAWYRISRFGEILNLGISHIQPGSVRWQGTNFSALGLADKRPMHVTGWISRLSNGVPCELNVRYSNSMAAVEYRLAYQYDGHVPPFYPKRVSLFVKHGLKETEYRGYEILSVKTASHPLPETHFDPDHRLQNTGIQLRLLTNDAIYLRLPGGTLLKSGAPFPKTRLSAHDFYENRYFYLSLGLVSLGFVRVFLQCNNKPETKGME